MLIRVKWSALKEGHWYEYALRFMLGGAATVVAGIVAEVWGPAVGGLFLAFPAIFIASATMVEKHERERKERKGVKGSRRGLDAASLDAAGAAWGTPALASFACVTVWAAELPPALCLSLAAAVWLTVAIVLFFVRRAVRVRFLAASSGSICHSASERRRGHTRTFR